MCGEKRSNECAAADSDDAIPPKTNFHRASCSGQHDANNAGHDDVDVDSDVGCRLRRHYQVPGRGGDFSRKRALGVSPLSVPQEQTSRVKRESQSQSQCQSLSKSQSQSTRGRVRMCCCSSLLAASCLFVDIFFK